MAIASPVVDRAPIGRLASVFPGIPTFGRTVVGRGGVRLRAVSVKDIGPAGIDVRALEEIAVPHVSDVDRYLVRPGDVLLSARGTVLKVAIVPEALAGAVATATLAVIRPVLERILPEVLAAYLRSPAGQAELRARARSATGQIALTARDIRAMKVPVPPMEDQRRIAALVRALGAYETAAGEALRARREITAQFTARLMAAQQENAWPRR